MTDKSKAATVRKAGEKLVEMAKAYFSPTELAPRLDASVLEDRILYSATPVPIDPSLIEGEVQINEVDAALIEAAAIDGENAASSTAGVLPGDESLQELAALLDGLAAEEADRPEYSSLEVVFVDEGVEGSQILIDGLRESTDTGTEWLVIEISSQSNGIEQISTALSQLEGVDAIHIVSHGDGQGIQLGDSRLDLDSASGSADDIASWSSALDEDADILIYGCDLASTDEGRALVDALAELCDCDIAASDDETGHEDLGGDWEFEYLVGAVETQVFVGEQAQADWQDVLATIVVTTTSDENDGNTSSIAALQGSPGGAGISLREAIIAANNTAGDDTIVLAAGTYTLSIVGGGENAAATGDLDTLSNITISGAGIGSTVINGGGFTGIFEVHSGTLSLDNLDVTNGYWGSGTGAAATVDAGGTLNIDHVDIHNNTSANNGAGGIHNKGVFFATDSLIRNNVAANNEGGGLLNEGTATLNRVSIVGNSAFSGGGIQQTAGSVTLTNVTVSGNSTDFDGAGMRVSGGTANVDYSTFANNNTTNAGNGGGIHHSSGTTNVSNSIFVDNSSDFGGGDLNGSVSTGGYNIIEDYSGFTAAGSDITGAVSINPLTYDSSSGQYVHVITAGGLAHNAANGGEPATDQRGVARVGAADIGAYEVGAGVNTQPVGVDDPADYNTTLLGHNPIGYWTLGDSSGAAVDSGSAANDGTYNGTALGASGAISGSIDTAADFDRSAQDYLEIAHDDAYLIDEGTIQLWFNADDLASDQALISKDSSNYDTGGHFNIEVQTDGSLQVRQQSDSASFYIDTTSSLVSAGNWYHMAYTFGSGGMELYLNGNLVGSNGSYTGGLGTSSGGTGNYEPIVIGASQQVSGDLTATPLQDYFDGKIDEVAIIGSQLTESQIDELYTAPGQKYTLAEDSTLNVDAANGVLANDYDPEADSLTAILVNGPSNASSFTLNADGSFDYTPNAGFDGTDSFTYKANDGSLDSDTVTVSLTVTGDNDAPVLSGSNDLTSINEDDFTNGGTLVSALISGHITDPDGGSVEGIAVVAVDDTNGTWEYTTNGGSNWTAFGSVDNTSARLLATDANTLVRFVPDADFSGTVTNGITFHAWDQTSGTAGSTADLSLSDLTVLDTFGTVAYSNNDGAANWTSNWTETDDDGSASNGDVQIQGGVLRLHNAAGGTLPSITRQVDLSGASSATFSFDYSGNSTGMPERAKVWVSDNGGSTWVELDHFEPPQAGLFSGSGSYDLGSSVSLTNNMVIRFSLEQGFGSGTDYFDIDNVQVSSTAGGTGGTTAFSTASDTASLVVNAVNDEQVLSTNAGDTVAEGSTGNVVTTAMLETTDVDNTDSQLVYTVDSLPGNGVLYRNAVALNATDTFTQADIDANLITYNHDGSQTSADSFDFTVDDGAGTTTSSTFNWTISNVNDAPVESSIEGSTLAYTENAGAVGITSTLSLSDVDDTDLESAVVQITGNYANGQDVLSFVNQNGITGSWDSGSGTMTLTGTATVAEYETALRSITYTNGSDNPSTATRTVSFTVNDGEVDSNTQTRDISIAATNDDPTGTGLPSDITVTEDVSSDVDLSALNLSDLDENGGNLTVTLTTSTGGDLSASSGGGITVGGSGTGTLTLSGTLTDLNTFLDTSSNVQYLHGTAHTFGNDADTIQVVVNDGGNTGSGGGTDQTIGTVNVDITAVNDEQVLSTNAGDTVAEGSTGNVVTTAMLETTDVDNTDSQLVYTVDSLPGNGVLYRNAVVLNATDTFTQADIDANLITYDHDGSQTSADSFDFTVDDGVGTTTSSTFNWTISNVNDAPVEASIEGSTLAYTENDGAIGITSTLSLSDVDDTDLESAVVQITGNYANGQDVLSFVNQNGITGSWDSGSGTMTLSGTATVAEYETALRSITYTNGSDNPSTSTRTVSFTVNDGDVDSNTQTRDISIAATNDDPTGTGLPTDITVTEDVSSNVDLSALNLSDLDANSSSLTVTLTTSTGGDLSASSGGGITVGGSGTGTLTLTGTLTDLNTFMDTASNVQYLHGTAHTFGNDADTIQVVVNDGGNTGSGGGTDQTIGTVNVDITAVNDEQVLSTNAGDTVAEGSTGNVVTTAMLETTDVDNTDSQLVYTVDSLPGNGVLYRNAVALNATDTFTQADIDANLITYDHDGSQTSADSFDFTVDDGVGTTTSSTFNWTISNVNDAPVESSIEGSTLAYTENAGAVSITSTLSLSDVDDTDLESAVVQITGNYANGQDVLSFVNQNGITGSWDSGSGTMTLTGTATVAEYETALRSITYTNGSDNPSTSTRTVSFNVNDGDVDSNTQTRDISIAATNDDPTGTGLPTDIAVTEDVSSNVDLSALNLSDLDANSSSLTVTLSTSTGGDLSASSGGGVTVGGSGTGTLTLSGTLTDLNTFLDTSSNVQYLHGTAHTFGNDADTIQVVVNDGGNTGSGGGTDQTIGTVNVDITAVNDEQVLSTNAGDTVAEGSTGNVVTTAMLETTDVDNTDSQLVYTVDSLPGNGVLYRNAVALNATDTFTQADIDANLITYNHDGSQTSADSFDFTVDDGTGTTTSSTFNWTISNVNDAPVESSIEGSTLAYTENAGAVSITSTLSLADVDDTDLESAVVQITGNYANGQDVLSFVNQNGITGSWDSGSGTMTLSGTATVSEYETALRSITYTNGSDNPSTATRTVSFTVNDGDVDSNTQTRDISIAATNDDPTGTGLPTDITVTEDVSSNVDLSALNLSDLDENGGSLTVTLTTSTGGDLSASSGGGITVGGSGTGTLTLSGTLADLNTFLDTSSNVQYLHGTAHTFGNDADTIQVVVNDGGNTGSGGGTDQTIGTVNVDITAVNDAAVESSIEGSTLAYTENAGAVSITSTLSLSDVDDTDLESAVVQITGNYANGQDVLSFVNQNGITGSWDSGSGTMTLTGTATVAEYETALRSITYANGSDNPSTSTRTVSFTVNDGDVDSNTQTRDISIAATNDDPTGTGLPTDITVTEDASSNVDLSALNLSDLDENGGSLTVTLTTSTGGDLSASSGGGITVGGSGTGTLTLSGTLTDLNTFMDTASNVQYLHGTAHTFGNDADTIQVVVNDGGNTGSGGGTDQTIGTVNVDITAVNDEQVLSTNAGDTVSEGSTGNVVTTAMLETTDVDNTDSQLVYTVDSLPGNGVLYRNAVALNATDTFTQADIDANLITYNHDGSQTSADSFDFTVDDGTGTTTSSTFNWTISNVNDAPVESSIEGSTLAYTENAGAVSITSTLSLSDVDDTDLESAVVQITGNYANGQDVLSFVNQNGITGSWDSGSGTMTLSGTATVSEYETALRSITYTNGSDNPSTSTRTVSFTVNDGDVDSNTQTRDISIAATNDDPTGTGLPSDITVTEDVSSNVDLSALNLSDLDANSSSLTVTLSTSTGGDLSASSGGGITVGGSGTGTLTLTGTLTDLNTFMDTASNVQYLHGTAHTFGNDADTIQVVVNDGGNTGSGGGTDQTIGTVNVDITAVNDEQVLSTNAGDTVAEGSTGNVVTTAMLETTDVDNTDSQLVYTVDSLPGNGVLYRNAVVLNATDTFTQADIDANLITYDHDGSQTSADSFDFTVDDGTGTTTSSTFNWTISNVNDAPVESSIEGSTLAYTENAGAVGITSTLSLSDVDDTDLESAVVQITGNYANGQDVLSFVNQNGITGSWDSGSGTMTLSGTATVSEYETALRSITYTNGSDNPSTSTRTVSFTVNDGDVDSNTQTRDISIAATNDDPTGTGLPSDITVTEDVSSNVDLSALNLSDLDANSSSLTVTLSTSTGGDLSASSGGGITVGGSGTGTLTLTGTLTDLNTFMDTASNVQYLHGTAHTFGNDADTIQVVVNDGGNTGSGGGTDQTIGTVNVDITAVNDTPNSAPHAYSANYGETLSVDAPGLLSGAMDIDGDALTAVLISGPSSGVLVLNPDGSFSFTPDSGATGQLTFEFAVSDGQTQSSTQTVTVDIAGGGVLDPDPDPDSGESDSDSDPESETEEEGDDSEPEEAASEESSSTDTAVEDSREAEGTAPQLILVASQASTEESVDSLLKSQSFIVDFEPEENRGDETVFGHLTELTDQDFADSPFSTAQRQLMDQLQSTQMVFANLEKEIDEQLQTSFLADIDPVVFTALGTGAVITILHVGQIAATLLSTASACVQLDPLTILQNVGDFGDIADTSEELMFENDSPLER